METEYDSGMDKGGVSNPGIHGKNTRMQTDPRLVDSHESICNTHRD
jgi:hypothetical protein